MRRAPQRVDFSVYLRAFGVYAKNPTVIVVPLLIAVVAVLVAQVSGVSGGGGLGEFTNGIIAFFFSLLSLFGLGVAVIIGDAGWRRGRASFDDCWQDARRKGGDILFAAFGFTFVLTIAAYAGQILGGIGIILSAIAVYFLIYAIPAAAIGGVPGGAAIQASIDRVRAIPLTAAFDTVIFIVGYLYFASFVGVWIEQLLVPVTGGTGIIAALIDAVLRAIVTGYVAIVLAKNYSDVAFTRNW